MKCTVGLAFLLGLVAAPALAQEPGLPSPAPELTKFEGLIGEWTGSGILRDSAAEKGNPWTATTTFTRLLDGHAVQDDTVVDLGAEYPSLVMRSIYAWDAEARKYVSYSMSNFGEFSSQDAHWLADGSLVSAHEDVDEHGNPTIERYIRRLSDKGLTLRVERSTGSGEVYVHVEGLFTKGTGATKTAVDASATVLPPSDAIKRLKPMLGQWRIAGEMVMMPGSDPAPIGGTETIAYDFGGHVLAAHVIGDPIPGMEGKYEGFGYIAWNERNQCYDSVSVDNMGVCGTNEGRWEGKRDLVFTRAATFMGKPIVERMVISFDDKGLKGVASDRMTSTLDAERTFKASYTPVK